MVNYDYFSNANASANAWYKACLIYSVNSRSQVPNRSRIVFYDEVRLRPVEVGRGCPSCTFLDALSIDIGLGG